LKTCATVLWPIRTGLRVKSPG
jgi:hypothetical protein